MQFFKAALNTNTGVCAYEPLTNLIFITDVVKVHELETERIHNGL